MLRKEAPTEQRSVPRLGGGGPPGAWGGGPSYREKTAIQEQLEKELYMVGGTHEVTGTSEASWTSISQTPLRTTVLG